jgi:hypothetical protein
LKIEDGEEHFKEDDIDAPTYMMIEEKKGTEIYDKMINYVKTF